MGLQVINDNLNKRMMLMVMSLIFFFSTFILFATEYDKQSEYSWKKKEQKLIENTYLNFLNKYYKKEKLN